jgi:hypothetical protein
MLIPQTQQNLGFTEVPGWSRMMVFMIKKKMVLLCQQKKRGCIPQQQMDLSQSRDLFTRFDSKQTIHQWTYSRISGLNYCNTFVWTTSAHWGWETTFRKWLILRVYVRVMVTPQKKMGLKSGLNQWDVARSFPQRVCDKLPMRQSQRRTEWYA